MVDIQHKDITGAYLHYSKAISGAGTPVGSVTPNQVGERYFDTTNNRNYVSTGTGNTNWRDINSLNTVHIRTLSDLPTPAGGEHLLVNDCIYLFEAEITSADSLRLPDSSHILLKTAIEPKHGFNYTGTGAAIICDNLLNLECPSFRLKCPNGSLFDITSTTSGSIISFNSFIFEDINDGGTIKDVSLQIFNFGGLFDFGTGITHNGADIFKWTNCAILNGKNSIGSVAQTFKGNIGLIQKTACSDDIQSNETLYDFDIDDVINPLVVNNAEIQGNATSNAGTVFATGSADQTTIKYNLKSNGDIEDSRKIGLIKGSENTTETEITTTDTWTKVAITTTEDSISERFSGSTDCRLTYNGTKNTKVNIISSISASGQAADKNFQFAIYKNATVNVNDELVTGTQITPVSDATLGSITQKITMPNLVSVVTDEFFEVFVKNLADTANPLIRSVVFVVND